MLKIVRYIVVAFSSLVFDGQTIVWEKGERKRPNENEHETGWRKVLLHSVKKSDEKVIKSRHLTFFTQSICWEIQFALEHRLTSDLQQVQTVKIR